MSIIGFPPKNEPPLVINSNTVVTRQIAFQCFQMIALPNSISVLVFISKTKLVGCIKDRVPTSICRRFPPYHVSTKNRVFWQSYFV